ncbi:MAG: imidazoleglycerol-phosphate dehydratase [Armatimonadetes bacterium]|nr:imidazoleglycerol-phosphate dehydratase [Armatimonadota bacterium]
MNKGAPNVRYAEMDRESRSTKVHFVIDLDGGSRCDVSTGVSMFDEMLHEIARSARIDLGVSVETDINADDHSILEDVGQVFGRSLRRILEDSDHVVGAGSAIVPSGDALLLCAIDTAGHACLGWDVPFRRDYLGDMATENVKTFFDSLAFGAHASLHFRKLSGENDRHLCEAVFRSFGNTLFAATRVADRRNGGGKK